MNVRAGGGCGLSGFDSVPVLRVMVGGGVGPSSISMRFSVDFLRNFRPIACGLLDVDFDPL